MYRGCVHRSCFREGLENPAHLHVDTRSPKPPACILITMRQTMFKKSTPAHLSEVSTKYKAILQVIQCQEHCHVSAYHAGLTTGRPVADAQFTCKRACTIRRHRTRGRLTTTRVLNSYSLRNILGPENCLGKVECHQIYLVRAKRYGNYMSDLIIDMKITARSKLFGHSPQWVKVRVHFSHRKDATK